MSSVRSGVAPLLALSSGSVEYEMLTWQDVFGFVCVQATLCMAEDLFVVRELSVPLASSLCVWPKHSSLYMEGSVPDAPFPVAQSNDAPLRTAHFREGPGLLVSLSSDLTEWLEYLSHRGISSGAELGYRYILM